MHTHLIKKCEEDQIRVVEVVLFHITIALMRGGYSLVTLLYIIIHCLLLPIWFNTFNMKLG